MENLDLINKEMGEELSQLMEFLKKSESNFPKDVFNRVKKIQKLQNKAIKIAEKRFADLVKYASIPIAIYEPVNEGEDFVFVEFNPAAERAEKIKRKALLGKRVTEVFPGVKKFGLFDVFKKVWETGRAIHFPLSIYEDDRIKGYRENDVFKLPSGRIVAIYKDLTEQKRYEEKLKLSEKKYRHLFNSLNDAVFVHPFVVRGFGKFIEVNDIACKRLGYSRAELLNMTAADISDPEFVKAFLASEAQNNPLFKKRKVVFETYHIKKNGRKVPVEILSTFGEYEGQEIIISVARDISERKKAEKEIKKKVEELERLNNSMVGRELKMIELKKEINELREKLGLNKKYTVDFLVGK